LSLFRLAIFAAIWPGRKIEKFFKLEPFHRLLAAQGKILSLA
jgi:hypothetical protein